MKFCPQCSTLKPLSDFSPRSGERSHQFRSWCKECNCDKTKKAYQKNPEPRRVASREYKLAHPEETKKYAEEYYWANPEKARVATRKWYRENKVRANERQRRRWNKKYAEDVGFRLREALRGRLHGALRSTGLSKSESTMSLLGCSLIWLEIHLASLFKPGMTWENHGSLWHIDHVKPCASFNLGDSEQQRACFHWTNLQPLFALENRLKSDRYDTPQQSSKEIGSRCCQSLTR